MDSATSQIFQVLPNQFTPMAFFPPDVAFQVTVSLYIIVGALSVMIWDILIHLGEDYRLLTRYPVRPPTVIYFISRWSTLGYLLAVCIVYTTPVDHCVKVPLFNILIAFAIPSTSLLFFLRVQALYSGNKWVVGFFIISWLGVLGSSLTSVFGVHGSNIGITKYCFNSSIENYVSATALAPLINNTLIFLATAYKLTQNTHSDEGFRNNAKVAFFGYQLPSFSKGLLQDGQAYYLSTISLNLVTVILIYNHNIPVVGSFIGIPNIVLMNAMACSIFRKFKFGIFRASTTSWSSNSSLLRLTSPRLLPDAIVFQDDQTRMTASANTRDAIQVMSANPVAFASTAPGIGNCSTSPIHRAQLYSSFKNHNTREIPPPTNTHQDDDGDGSSSTTGQRTPISSPPAYSDIEPTRRINTQALVLHQADV